MNLNNRNDVNRLKAVGSVDMHHGNTSVDPWLIECRLRRLLQANFGNSDSNEDLEDILSVLPDLDSLQTALRLYTESGIKHCVNYIQVCDRESRVSTELLLLLKGAGIDELGNDLNIVFKNMPKLDDSDLEIAKSTLLADGTKECLKFLLKRLRQSGF